MIGQNFLYSLSATIAEDFLEKLSSSSLNISNKKIKVVGKTRFGSTRTTPCNVEDYIIKISFSDFANLADRCQTTELPSFLKQKVWTECTEGKGDGFLEIFINSYIREKGAFYDVTIRNGETKEFKILCFRKSADFITQRPIQKQCKPIYQDSFDLLQEVCQGEYAITCADDTKPVLASWHFANCVGFVAFSEIHKIGVVAHIDSVASYECLFSDMKKVFITDGTSLFITIEYVLVGGSDVNLRETIQSFAANAKEDFLEFKCIEFTSMSIPEKAFEEDSWWTSSVRLDRSIALDTRRGSFTNCLMSYEACLNPASSRHKRLGTAEETHQFEEIREDDNALKKVYDSVSK